MPALIEVGGEVRRVKGGETATNLAKSALAGGVCPPPSRTQEYARLSVRLLFAGR